jgi:hypothetical protein
MSSFAGIASLRLNSHPALTLAEFTPSFTVARTLVTRDSLSHPRRLDRRSNAAIQPHLNSSRLNRLVLKECLVSKAILSSRRRFLQASAATAVGAALPVWSFSKGAPAIIAAEDERTRALQGLHFGDPSNGSVVVWSRSDRPARMLVEWS